MRFFVRDASPRVFFALIVDFDTKDTNDLMFADDGGRRRTHSRRGINGYIVKPIRYKEFLNVVASQLAQA